MNRPVPAAVPGAGAVLALARELVARASVTPEDAGCQALVGARLASAGFVCETLAGGGAAAPVTNLWAVRDGGLPGPLVVFAGHTDVVPAGDPAAWASPPFEPTVRDGCLWGRGAADMKSSVAAMVVAAERFAARQPRHRGRVALLLTSDEEGPALHGTALVVEALRARGVAPDACIVGEPTCVERLGDTIKNGRRGSLSARLTVRGIQGHVAYPQLARNPVHEAAPALAELAAASWDEGNAGFPPTTWQISGIHAGTGAGNVIPGTLVVDFNFRFGTASTPAALQQRVDAVLARHGLDYALEWTLGASPFLTGAGALCDALVEAIRAETGVTASLSTTGGTSDGRFLATICPQVVEFGPCNASIHKVDEHVALAELEPLAAIYGRVLERLLA